jgi:hypothetical protein
VGSGVIGLFTCREILKQHPGVKVHVYASCVPSFGEKDNSKLITSQVAPGLWFPFHYGREKDADNQRIACLSYRNYQEMAKEEQYRSVVRAVEMFDLTD